jgi:uncharacterized cupredoxin-like copper-binding protein
MVKRLAAVGMAIVLGGAFAAACGNGEDRPGQASASGSGSGSGSGSASGSGTASGDEEALAFEEADADTVVHVELHDFAFVGIPASVKGPKVFFEAANKGANDHELEIFDASGDAVDEIGTFAPAKTKELAVEIEPGTYTVQCHVETNGKHHTELGMKTTFTVE